MTCEVRGYTRYALYILPEGPLYQAGSRWLGWDACTGEFCQQPDLPGLEGGASRLTRRPRKYGFHGTIKAPFRLRDGHDLGALDAGVEEFAARQPRFEVARLCVHPIGPFFALVPEAPSAALHRFAASVVQELDQFRAPLTDAERARRRPDRLSAEQRALLEQWGYPYVLNEFQFHLTLTGPVSPGEAATVRAALNDYLAPELAQPLSVTHLSLMGEAKDGYFHLIRRYALSS